MGREAYIVINVERYSESIFDIIKKLDECGWSFYDSKDEVSYLPLGDTDDSDWRVDKLSYNQVEELINKKQANNEKVGIDLFYKSHEEGIVLLADNTQNIMFNMDINKRNTEYGFLDIGWYFQNLIIPLREKGCDIASLCYMDYTD